MKKENFKVGQIVYFMESNKPKSSEVRAVLIIEGKMEISYTKFEVPAGEKLVVYQIGFSTLKEDEVFESMELLKESIFKTIENA